MVGSDAIAAGLLALAAIAGFAAALLLRDLLRALVAYAAATVAFAGVVALLGAPVVAAVELAVGAGVIAVLLLVAVVVTRGEDDEPRSRAAWVSLAAIGVAAGLALALLPALGGGLPTQVWLGPWLWDVRGADVIAQAILLLVATLGVILVVGRGTRA